MNSINQLDLRSKKYIIFDMDGTLIDSIGVWNITDQKLIKKYANITIDLGQIQIDRDSFLHNNQDSDIYLAYCRYLIERYNFSIKDSEELLKIRWNISNEFLEKEMDFKQDVADLIYKLKELGYILILATMTTKEQINVYSRRNKKMYEKMNIEEVFDLITSKEDVNNKKPHPEIYFKIMEYYNASPEECLVFEDSYTGVLASNSAGIEVVNIYDKYADIDRDKINEITNYSILNYGEFIELVNSQFPNGYIDAQKTEKKLILKKYIN